MKSVKCTDGKYRKSFKWIIVQACLVRMRLQAPDVSDEPYCPPFFPSFRSWKPHRSQGLSVRPE